MTSIETIICLQYFLILQFLISATITFPCHHCTFNRLGVCYISSSTKDCRWYSAMPFILRLIVVGIFANSANLPFAVIVLVLKAILNILIDPYKHNFRYITSHITTSNLFIAIFLVIIIGMDYAFKFNCLQTYI